MTYYKYKKSGKLFSKENYEKKLTKHILKELDNVDFDDLAYERFNKRISAADLAMTEWETPGSAVKLWKEYRSKILQIIIAEITEKFEEKYEKVDLTNP